VTTRTFIYLGPSKNEHRDLSALGARLVRVVSGVHLRGYSPQSYALLTDRFGRDVRSTPTIDDDVALWGSDEIVEPGRVGGGATFGRDENDVIAIERVDERSFAIHARFRTDVLQ
jgi:hypothetical protein